ncbi:MAG: class I SAM-dependent methyltransferase [Anaerolineae bacterium]|jgi:SAM-dependent methyltransferase
MTRDYLVELLNAYWFAPPVALWRAIELRVAGQRRYERPLLDLGCGDGLIGQVLFGTERQVDVGLDPWMDQLRRAADSMVYRHLDQAEGDAMPYADQRFATVFSNSVLEHIRNVAPVLREVRRVLEPGGRFIFTVPSDAFHSMLDGYARRIARGDAAGAEAYAAAVDERLAHHHYHAPETWRELLSDAGMRLLEITYYIPEQVERFWDRMNVRYGVGQRGSVWSLLVSPRLRFLGFQRHLQRLVVERLARRWRRYYQMDVQPGTRGGGLLVAARRE